MNNKSLKDSTKIFEMVESAIIEVSKNCGSRTCKISFSEKELIEEWIKNPREHTVECPSCKEPFIPSLKIANTLLGITIGHNFLFPGLFAREAEKIIKCEGVVSFLLPEFFEKYNEMFWNMILYFQLIDKPWFMLSLHFDLEVVQDLLKEQAKNDVVMKELSFGDLFEQWGKYKIGILKKIFKRSKESNRLLSTTYEEHATEESTKNPTISQTYSYVTRTIRNKN